jgi:hypothetical protein
VKLLFNTSLASTFLRNCFIQLIWWIVFFPGFYSTDSFAVLQMAKSGELNGMWSAPWALLVKFLTFGGSYPGIATLFFGIIFSISITVFTNSLFSPKRSALISGVLHLTPLVGAMGITLWHDIPMTAGFLLVSTFCIGVIKSGIVEKSALLKLLIPGLILSTFRGNGLPTVLLFLLIFIIVQRRTQKKSLILVGVGLSITTLLISGSQMTAKGLSDYELATSWIIYDVSCFANTANGKGFVEKHIPKIGSTESWSSKSACTWFTDAKLTSADIAKARNELPGLLSELVKEDLGFVISTHMKRHEYLVPLPVYGLPKPPFIHSTIEFTDSDIKWKFESLAEAARNYVRVWNYLSFLFAYAGFWFLFLVVTAFRKKNVHLMHISILSFLLIVTLFIFAGISDARYVLYILIAGQVVGLDSILDVFQKVKDRYKWRAPIA